MKKSKIRHYRQGDVLIERISSMPAKLKAIAQEHGLVVLAHGEVTGHHHAFAGAVAEKFVDEKGAEFFDVKGERLSFRLPIARLWKNQVMVDHPDHGLIEFCAADVEIIENQVVVDGDYGLLKHDEHHTHGIPAGLYKGAGWNATVRQREYSPEALRNVAD